MSSKIQRPTIQPPVKPPTIEPPTRSEKIGRYNNILYVRHQGRFVWENSLDRVQSFAVPYEITTPVNPAEGNRTFVFEPPHHTGGPVSRDAYLGPEFLFSLGFSHASVGFSNLRMRILNPNPGFPMKIKGEPITMIDFGQPGAVTDTNILEQFALALKQSSFLGPVGRIYGIGFSDSGNTLHQVYQPFGNKLFDLSFACTAPYPLLAPFPGQNPIIVFNTERDFDSRAIPDPQFPQYRWYAVAGAPHIPDSVLTRPLFKDDTTPPIAGTTPIEWSQFIRALFVAGDQWIRQGTQPPPSVTLMLNPQGLIARDEMCNALGGIRHPALECGEATFIKSVVRPNLEPKFWENFGGYGSPKKNPSDFPQYLQSFTTATEALVAARYLLPEDGERLIKAAELQPPNTFTRNYMNGLFP